MTIIGRAVEFLKEHPGESFYPAQLVSILGLECFDSSLANSLRRQYRNNQPLPGLACLRKEEKPLKRGGYATAYYWGHERIVTEEVH